VAVRDVRARRVGRDRRADTSWSASWRSCLHSCGRLAFSNKNGRELLPMLKYSARAQLQLGALLAVVLVFRIVCEALDERRRCFACSR